MFEVFYWFLSFLSCPVFALEGHEKLAGRQQWRFWSWPWDLLMEVVPVDHGSWCESFNQPTNQKTRKNHKSYHKKHSKKHIHLLLFSGSVSAFSLLLFCFWNAAGFERILSSPFSQPAPASSPPAQRAATRACGQPFKCTLYAHSIILLSALPWATSWTLDSIALPSALWFLNPKQNCGGWDWKC